MTLITDEGERPDPYRRIDDADGLAATDGDAKPLLALSLLQAGEDDEPAAIAAAALPADYGLAVANDTPIAAIEPYIGAACLIAVDFPAFSDGRGLSMATRLRRAGFTGTLRASGPLIADQFADALACGFDEVDLPETMANRQPVQQWMAAKGSITDHYQRHSGKGQSILQKRMAARAGGCSDTRAGVPSGADAPVPADPSSGAGSRGTAEGVKP